MVDGESTLLFVEQRILKVEDRYEVARSVVVVELCSHIMCCVTVTVVDPLGANRAGAERWQRGRDQVENDVEVSGEARLTDAVADSAQRLHGLQAIESVR